MKFIRNLPNILTLFNLFLGCLAIVYIFYDHMVIIEERKNTYIDMGRMEMASLCIFLAAVIDFLDGFLARILKAQSALGKELDSLADIVTFGLVPGVIMYQLIARSYYASSDAFDYPVLYFCMGFAITLCSAFRLAKFNIAINQQYDFRGLPTPSSALIIASFPLIILRDEFGLADLFAHKFFLITTVIILCYLMVSDVQMIGLKIKSISLQDNFWQITLVLAAIVIMFAGVFIFDVYFIIIPVIILFYIILSITKNIKEHGI